MQKIIIHQLGPVAHCELELNHFMVFTGPQASGKSTVAKSIFFFKNIKNLLYTQLRKNFLLTSPSFVAEIIPLSAKNRIIREIRANFLQIFGTTWHMEQSMYLQYYYSDNTFVKITLREDLQSPNYIWVDLSEDLVEFLSQCSKELSGEGIAMRNKDFLGLKEDINALFHDEAETVYIPAGRSMITLLGTQLNYIYSSMDDMQKKNLDYCTQNYLERILQMKPEFSISIAQMIKNAMELTDIKLDKQLIFEAGELMREILKGEYRNVNGEERLQVSDDRYVKINFSSSGQQEAVWILNVLFYYLLHNRKAYFIIEEPESHLFPNAQKLMMEFIALIRYQNRNQVFITTHSPYILGTINNLLYANKIAGQVYQKDLEKIISRSKWLDFKDLSAFFICDGSVAECVDREFESIENEIIDGAAEEINADYEKMILLKENNC